MNLISDEKGVDSLAQANQDDRPRVSAVRYRADDFAKAGAALRRFSASKRTRKARCIQPLFVCALDDTLWLPRTKRSRTCLKKHFGTFYQAERTATEPPKGKYTFVAQCGMSGVILGPPNYHDYQNQLRKLHAERFSRDAVRGVQSARENRAG